MWRRSSLVTLVLVSMCLLSIGIACGAAASDAPGDDPDAAASISPAVGSATAATSGDVLDQTFVVDQLPDRPGEFAVELTVEVPDAVTELEVTLHGEAAIDSTDGFERTGDGTVEWTGTTDRPTVTYTLPANRTSVGGDRPGDDPHDGGGYYFVETGEWGIVQAPQASLSWRETSSVSVDRSVVVDGPGAVGSHTVVFGEVTEHENEAGAETHRLVVLEAAEMRESPADVLDALETAYHHLQIGDENGELFVVAAPSDVGWGPNGLQYGDGDAWVRADAPLDAPNNVWIHEYVHSRQSFAGSSDGTTSETEWLIEGQADYYAALLTYEEGLIGYDAFRGHLDRGRTSPYDEGVLVEPSTWGDEHVDYVRGPLVLAAIDREIRLATDGERTLADAFREVNRADAPISQRDFLDAVEAHGGPEARATAEKYTETKAVPDTWSRDEHRDAFDVETTTFEAGLADGPIVVSGEFREAEYEALPIVVPGETVAFPVRVENVGDAAGPYDARLTVDGRVVDERSGRLDPGGEVVETVEWTPEQPGEYDVRAGDETIAATVDEPAEVRVTALSAKPRTGDPGDAVTVVATVAADDELPSASTLEVRTVDGVVDEHEVRLGPGETTTVETTLTFDEEGRYEVAVGDETTTVGIGAAAALEERVDSVAETVPGFGPLAGVVAIACAIALLARFARRP